MSIVRGEQRTPGCVGCVGHLFGHRFEPRFDEVQHEPDFDPEPFFKGSGTISQYGIAALLEEQRKSVRVDRLYRGSVCVRCGLWSGVPQ